MAIRLEGPPKSTVPQDVAQIQQTLDLIGKREQLRQDKSKTTRFLARQIELQGQNPGISPELITQQVALELAQEEPQFSGGIAGGFQKFASGLAGPSTTFTAPIVGQLLEQPQGINAEKVRAAIDAQKALTSARTGKGGVPKATPQQKQRDTDAKILDNEKSSEGSKVEARNRLIALEEQSPGTLFTAKPSKEFDDEIEETIKATELKKDVSGKMFKFFDDEVFGEEAFNELREAMIEEGLKSGISPESMGAEFDSWWDRQAESKNPKGFGKRVKPRSEFQAEAGTDLASLIQKALDAGNITAEEAQSAQNILQNDPAKEDDIKKALGL